MFVSKSLVSSITNQLRSNARCMHSSPLLLKYPVGKTGKPLTPYIRFTTEKRPEITRTNPDLSIPEVGRKLGELWRALPESERQRYRDEYAKAKTEA